MHAARSVAALVMLLGVRTSVAEPENYERIRADGGLTMSRGAVEGRKGFGFSTEIKGMIHDNLSVGARVEVAFLFGGIVGDEDSELGFAMAACGLGKVEYLLGTSLLRPFAGLGLGVYSIGSTTIDTGPGTTGYRSSEGRYVGMAPQLGVDLGKVRFSMTYNALLGASIEFRETIGTAVRTTDISRNYVSIELSFQFAGGKKSKTSSVPPPEYPSYPPAGGQPFPPPGQPVPAGYPPPGQPEQPMQPAPSPPPGGGPSTVPPT
jgi:outer membrane protein X